MKFLRISESYPSYLESFYTRNSSLGSKTYSEQKLFLDADAFSWTGSWPKVLRTLGYETEEIVWNASFLQGAWARENVMAGDIGSGSGGAGSRTDGPANGSNDAGNGIRAGAETSEQDLVQIALAQVKHFRPDVLWYDCNSPNLITEIRRDCPKIRLIFGWLGSPLPRTPIWNKMDLMLSCAPETVQYLTGLGAKAEHLDHGFDPAVNTRLKPGRDVLDISFIGQILKGAGFHSNREEILKAVLSEVPLTIFSPQQTADSLKTTAKRLVKNSFVEVNSRLEKWGMAGMIRETAFGEKIRSWGGAPSNSVEPSLRRQLRPAVFGMEMLQIIKNSKVSLNIHADSSPTHASNMRLFEATGVGTCLLTDWRENLPSLFSQDTEVVTYKSPEECREKALWLVNHPLERKKIGEAGQRRTLKDHTFERRADVLHQIVKRNLNE